MSYTSGFNGLLRPPGKQWLANRIDPAAILAEARRARAYPARHEGVMPRLTFAELAPGRWTACRIETVATWIETTPRIRIVNLADAIADPTTPPDKRTGYLAAKRRITGYLQARGATPAGDAHDERWEDG